MIAALKVDPESCKIWKINVEAGPRGVREVVCGRIKRRFVFPNGDTLYCEVEPTVAAEFSVGGSRLVRGVAIILGKGGTSAKYSVDSIKGLFKFAK